MMRLGIMLSGTGSTYRAIAQAAADGILDAQIVRVVSSKAQAGGVEIAKGLGHPVSVIRPADPGHHEAIAAQMRADAVDLVVMAGYMHLWKLPADMAQRTINIHPALIPAFCGKGMYGMHVHEAVIAQGVRCSGCTVHLVDAEYDHGRILEQRVLAVKSTDTAQTLAARVQQAEKALLLHVIKNWRFYRESGK